METFYGEVRGRPVVVQGATPAQASALVDHLRDLAAVCNGLPGGVIDDANNRPGEPVQLPPALTRVLRDAMDWSRRTEGFFSIVRDERDRPLPDGTVSIHPSGVTVLPEGARLVMRGFLGAWLALESLDLLRREGVERGMVSVAGQVEVWGATEEQPVLHAAEHPTCGTIAPVEVVGSAGLSSVLLADGRYVTVRATDVLLSQIACRIIGDHGLDVGREWVARELPSAEVFILDCAGVEVDN